MRAVLCSLLVFATSANALTRSEVEEALKKATTFFDQKVRFHGGFVWHVSSDLKYREGEGRADDKNWVQPPGTPSVGEAFLEAYAATKDPAYLKMAEKTGEHLIGGQLESGGWAYHIEVDPTNRKSWLYRLENLQIDLKAQPSGWHVWKRRKLKRNLSTLDDDTTQAAVRFLMKLDHDLEMKHAKIHRAATYALDALLKIQYPNGGWSVSWDRFPSGSPSEKLYPVKKASFPEKWLRTWPNTWTGCYVTNDNLMSDMIDTLLEAHRIYRKKEYLQAAKKAGDFLILAQMPMPQPAWAQQYDADMHPVWSRKFEPPAISGGESQTILRSLMKLYRVTGEKKYLKPVPPALAYLKKSLRKDGKLARFYELKTNRPLYFYRDSKRRYFLTYKDDKLPTHYGFVLTPKIESLQREYDQIDRKSKKKSPKISKGLADRVKQVMTSMDDRGAWTEKGRIRAYKLWPKSGIITSSTFIRNVSILCQYLRLSR